MGTSAKYGTVTTGRKDIPADEPVFIIRAQDALACPAISAYWNLCEKNGASPEHLLGVEREYNRFADWQEANAPQKTPDTLPGEDR